MRANPKMAVLQSPIPYDDLYFIKYFKDEGAFGYLEYQLLHILKEPYEFKDRLRAFIKTLKELDIVCYIENDDIEPLKITRQLTQYLIELNRTLTFLKLYEHGPLVFNSIWFEDNEWIIFYRNSQEDFVDEAQ